MFDTSLEMLSSNSDISTIGEALTLSRYFLSAGSNAWPTVSAALERSSRIWASLSFTWGAAFFSVEVICLAVVAPFVAA